MDVPPDVLLDQLATDLDASFPHMVQEYQHQLYTFVYRLTGNLSDAEEIVQETFTLAYYALGGYPSTRVRSLKLRHWLYTIARNAFYNSVRKPMLSAFPLDDAEGSPQLEIEDEHGTQPEEECEKEETRREISTLVNKLPEMYRHAILLYYFEDFSYYEIASLLQQPVGTVKSNVHRALRLLRKMPEMGLKEVRSNNGA